MRCNKPLCHTTCRAERFSALFVYQILDLLTEAQRKRDAAMERAEKARIEADKFAAEAAAYQRALEAMGFADQAKSTLGGDNKTSVKQKRNRPLSQKWIEIYTSLYTSSDAPYDYQAIIEAAKDAGYEITDGAMRTQMMNAVNSGVFARVDAGLFRLTEKGFEAIGVSPEKNEPPKGGSETEDVDASSYRTGDNLF